MLNSLLKFQPIYIGYSDIIRSMGTSLTQENIDKLERKQKTLTKLVLREKFKSYENALLLLNMDNLETRRKDMILRFAKNGIKNQTLNDLFPINEKIHKMNKRTNEKYEVNFANTDRLKNASIITMQKLLNEDNVKNAT